jgi:hypothetical protein
VNALLGTRIDQPSIDVDSFWRCGRSVAVAARLSAARRWVAGATNRLLLSGGSAQHERSGVQQRRPGRLRRGLGVAASMGSGWAVTVVADFDHDGDADS